MRTAYLLAVFKVDGATLIHTSTEIHFERDPELGLGTVTFSALDVDGEDEDDARQRLIDVMSTAVDDDGEMRFEWAIRSLVQS